MWDLDICVSQEDKKGTDLILGGILHTGQPWRYGPYHLMQDA